MVEHPVRNDDGTLSNNSDHVRIPQIKLQMFNGDVNDWLSFFELFMSLIHRKMDVQKVKNFHYLKGSLQGYPKH